MKISSKRQTALYAAIADEIMRVRVRLSRDHDLPPSQDVLIAQVVHPIWERVKAVLNITDEHGGA